MPVHPCKAFNVCTPYFCAIKNSTLASVTCKGRDYPRFHPNCLLQDLFNSTITVLAGLSWSHSELVFNDGLQEIFQQFNSLSVVHLTSTLLFNVLIIFYLIPTVVTCQVLYFFTIFYHIFKSKYDHYNYFHVSGLETLIL